MSVASRAKAAPVLAKLLPRAMAADSSYVGWAAYLLTRGKKRVGLAQLMLYTRLVSSSWRVPF